MESNTPHKTINLEELSQSNFEIADDQPDINGWELADDQGNYVGEVEDLIFDPQEAKVRYVVVALDTDQENHSGYLLIPIGVVRLDEAEEELIISVQHAAILNTLPPYEQGKTISPVEELAIRYAFLGSGSLPHAEAVVYEYHPDDFYSHEHFRDSNFRLGKDE